MILAPMAFSPLTDRKDDLAGYAKECGRRAMHPATASLPFSDFNQNWKGCTERELSAYRAGKSVLEFSELGLRSGKDLFPLLSDVVTTYTPATEVSSTIHSDDMAPPFPLNGGIEAVASRRRSDGGNARAIRGS